MNHSRVNITSTVQERHVQYGHPAYQGAVETQDDSRFALVPPGVNLTVFDKNSISDSEENTINYLQTMLERDLNKDRLGLPCLVASSRLDRKKNHLGLMSAYASDQELRRISNLVILTSGLDDPLQEISRASPSEKDVLVPLLKLINENNLRGKVSMFSIRGQAQLGAAYRYFAKTGSIFVLPALHEPFGLAPLEAIAAGLPAVVTKFGGPSESLQDGTKKFGVLVDPTDPKELSSAIIELVKTPQMREKYAAAGYQRVVSTYNWESTASGYLKSLQRVKTNHQHQELLPIHPYFSDPSSERDITPAELQELYRGYPHQPDWL
jgi:sucrose-phosphate synthase